MEKKKWVFKVPNALEIKNALGPIDDIKDASLKKALVNVNNFFCPIKAPASGEWLDSHIEKGQTYNQYLYCKRNKVDKTHNTIFIAPLEIMEDSFLSQCLEYCKCFYYGLNVEIFKNLNLKDLNITNRINPYTKDIQYLTSDILNKTPKLVPPNTYAMICITNSDLYPNPNWNFVFGWALYQARVGVFSFCRYKQPFITPEEDLPGKLIFRAVKIMTHEIGHMFFFEHCTFYDCLMNGYNHFEEFEKKPAYLCPVCLRKLQLTIGFNCIEREKALYEICKKNGIHFQELENYYEKRLKYFFPK